MNMFLNIGLAKISTILAIIMSVIYVLRVVNKRFFNNEKNFLYNLNKVLRKHHKTLGIILVITGLVHGIYSSDSVLSLNWGTVCWVFSLLLGLSWMFRKKLKAKKSWMYYHRILTVLFLLTLVIHIAIVKDVFSFINNDIAKIDNSIIEYEEESIEGQIKDNGHQKRHGREEAENDDKVITNIDESIPFEDGTYTGMADGYRPNLNVEVVIEDGEIKSVEVTDNNETPTFLRRVVPSFTDEIVETQSTEVDSITRATKTCDAIIEATNEALENAQQN